MQSRSSGTAAHPFLKKSSREHAPTRPSLAPTLNGMRRSCEPCRRRKKKCDGGQPCRRCQELEDECTYSKRVWHMTHPQQPQQRDPGRGQLALVLQQSKSSPVMGHGSALSLKRCRLSASPATGLVGMQENTFLSDFFDCVGFLPLTTQSHIRETMVKIMLTPASRHHPAFEGEVGHQDGIVRNREIFSAFGGAEFPVGPSTCVFWCAVALGGLVRGNPTESVESYTQLATEALAKSCSGPANAEVAKAWANLAYLHGFMGDLAKFQEYLAHSDSIFTSLIRQGSAEALPVGFAEIIHHKDIGIAFPRNAFEELCTNTGPGSRSTPERKHLQLNGAITEPELYRHVMQSFSAFEEAIYSTVVNESAAYRKRLEEAGPPGEGTTPLAPHPQEIADAMTSAMQGFGGMFSNLQEVVDRPHIRAGVGGMLINGTLVFEVACTGDVANTFNRICLCVEVLERYPGLCRSVIGLHFAHMMLAALAALDHPGTREVYNRLRAAYNISRPHGASPAPPLEEWQRFSMMCDNLQCRATVRLIASDIMSAFSKPLDDIAPNGNGGDKDEEASPGMPVAGHNHGGRSAASIIPEQEAVVPAPGSPGSSQARCHLHSACETSGEISRMGSGWTERCMGSVGGEAARMASVELPFRPNNCPLEVKLDVEHGARGDIDGVRCGNVGLTGRLTPPHEMAGLGEVVEQAAIEDIAAADWLDVTHTLLEEANESGQHCR